MSPPIESGSNSKSVKVSKYIRHTTEHTVNTSWTTNLQVEEIIQIDEDRVILIARYETPTSPKPLSRSTKLLRKLIPPLRLLFKRLPLLLVAWRVLPKLWRSLREFFEHIADSLI